MIRARIRDKSYKLWRIHYIQKNLTITKVEVQSKNTDFKNEVFYLKNKNILYFLRQKQNLVCLT